MTVTELIEKANSMVITDEKIAAVVKRMEEAEEQFIQRTKISDDFMSRRYTI